MGLNVDLILKIKNIYIYFFLIINFFLLVKFILFFLFLGLESFVI